MLPRWWDRPIDPGRQYGQPLTWGGLVAPLLVVAVVLLWKYLALLLGAGAVGYIVYRYVQWGWAYTPWAKTQIRRGG